MDSHEEVQGDQLGDGQRERGREEDGSEFAEKEWLPFLMDGQGEHGKGN